MHEFSRIAPPMGSRINVETMKPIASEVPDFIRNGDTEPEFQPLALGEECPICHGAGWLRLDVPVGHPSFGRLIKCQCQVEIEAKQTARALRQNSRLAENDRRTFAAYETDTPEQTNASAVAMAFARNPDGWLVLSGRVGTGKTHLAAAIANDVQTRTGRTMIFAVVPDLLDYLRSTFDPAQSISFDRRFEEVRDCYLLVLDDIGTENATPWAREKLFQIINHRYNEHLPTIFTTNQPDSAIDERILSRMLDTALSRRVVFAGDDFRRRGDLTYRRGDRSSRTR